MLTGVLLIGVVLALCFVNVAVELFVGLGNVAGVVLQAVRLIAATRESVKDVG